MRTVRNSFSSPKFGNCNKGDPLNVSGDLAKQLEDAGFIEKETKKETKPEPKVKKETKPETNKKQTKK